MSAKRKSNKSKLLEYREINKQLNLKLEQLEPKALKYDELVNEIDNIKKRADFDAFRMIEDAQVQAMESIDVINNITKEVEVFKADIQRIKNDLLIGTLTVEDRIDSFYYLLNSNIARLNNIKRDFYNTNNIPIEE